MRNPAVPEGASTLKCERCQRDYPAYAKQCPYCGGRRGTEAAGGAVCAVCSEEPPGHGANCPEALPSLAPPRMRTADQDAGRDSNATAGAGWIGLLIIGGGAATALGIPTGMFVCFMLMIVYAWATRERAWSSAGHGLLTFIGLMVLAGLMLIGSVFIICSTASGHHY